MLCHFRFHSAGLRCEAAGSDLKALDFQRGKQKQIFVLWLIVF